MKKTITYIDLQKFDSAATNYLIKEGYFVPMIPAGNGTPAIPGFFTDKPVTKLVSNIKSIIKQSNKHFETFNELKSDLLIDCCIVDEKTNAILLNNDGKYLFTKEGTKELNTKIKELEKSEIDINSRITEGKLELTEEEKEIFNGIVIPEFIIPE